MTGRSVPLMAALLVSAVLVPLGAVAQTAAPATSGLQVTDVPSGWVVAPEVRFTRINDRAATLAGGSVGWLNDGTLFIGGAGYVIANRSHDFNMETLGALVRWNIGGSRPIALSPGLYVGGGTATLSRRYGDLFGPPPDVNTIQGIPADPHWRLPFPGTVTSNTPVRVNDSFLVAEPRVNAVLAVKPWLRLDVGAGYRFIGDSRWLEHQLRGASGSVAVVFGGR